MADYGKAKSLGNPADLIWPPLQLAAELRWDPIRTLGRTRVGMIISNKWVCERSSRFPWTDGSSRFKPISTHASMDTISLEPP